MRTQREVFNKLFKEDKTELAAQKIELESIQYLNKIISEGKSIYKRGVDFVNERDAFTKNARRLNTDADAMIKGGEKLINDFEKKVKDLGFDLNSISELKEAKNILGTLDTVSKQTNGYTQIRS